MSNHLWQNTLLRVRQNRFFRPLGGKILKIPGAGFVLRRFMHRVLPRGARTWAQISGGPAQGLFLNVEPYLEERYLTGCPEPDVQSEIVNCLRPGDCFYDVGAHIGFYSLVAARLVGEGGCVVAFEPDPANVATLQENISRNDLTLIETCPNAVWNHSGTVTFERSAANSVAVSSRRGKVVAGSDPAVAGRIAVTAVTLDQFAAGRRPPTFIKIDVEGGEAEVIEGARQTLARVKPIILVEVHHQSAATRLAALLAEADYKIEWLKGHPGYDFPRHIVGRPKVRPGPPR